MLVLHRVKMRSSRCLVCLLIAQRACSFAPLRARAPGVGRRRLPASVESETTGDRGVDEALPESATRSEIELFRCSDTQCVIEEVRGAQIESPASVAKQVRRAKEGGRRGRTAETGGRGDERWARAPRRRALTVRSPLPPLPRRWS